MGPETRLQVSRYGGAEDGDTHERKESEDALRRLSEQLAIVADNMAVAVTHCSAELQYLWVSKSYAQWIGRPIEEIRNRPILEIIGRTWPRMPPTNHTGPSRRPPATGQSCPRR